MSHYGNKVCQWIDFIGVYNLVETCGNALMHLFFNIPNI